MDKNFANIDIVNFKITRQIYKTVKTVIALANEQIQNGFAVDIDIKSVRIESPAEKVELNPKAKVSFKELFDEYVKVKESEFMINLDSPHHKLATIESICPLMKEAYGKLGKDEVIRLKYNQTNIRRELEKRLDISINSKIVKAINRCLTPHMAIPNAVIKERYRAFMTPSTLTNCQSHRPRLLI